jgi:predicted RNase H-like HicB family nuclease
MKRTTANDDILKLASAIHARLRQLETGGVEVTVTRAMEEILLNDPAYTPRLRGVRPNSNPGFRGVEDAARVLRTMVSALIGEQPHPAVYSGPPSAAEVERRRIHAERTGSTTPFTVLLFPPEGEMKAIALVAEFPVAQAVGETPDEALAALREALDALLIRSYENTLSSIETRGRAFTQAPFAFQPPAEGRTR